MKHVKESENKLGLYVIFGVLVAFGDKLSPVFRVLGWILLGNVCLLVLSAISFVICHSVTSKKLKRMLKRHEGRSFLVYSSNKRLKSTIEAELLPLIGNDHALIYKARETIKTGLDPELWMHLLQKTESLKFPRLVKIENEQVIGRSFYPEVYQLKYLEIDRELFKTRVLLKWNTLKNE